VREQKSDSINNIQGELPLITNMMVSCVTLYTKSSNLQEHEEWNQNLKNERW